MSGITDTNTQREWSLSICIEDAALQSQFPYVRKLSGLEELSALYQYELQVGTTDKASCANATALLGTKITIHVKNHESTIIRTIHGVIMSVASSTVDLTQNELKTADNKDIVWYLWTIRPEFAKSCYTLKRTVYNADALKAEDADKKNKNKGELLLEHIAEQWNTPIVISEQAKAKMPEFIQLIQNEESDYNFFTRILSAWGLGYVWDMKGGDNKDKERLLVMDMCSADRKLFIPDDKEADEQAKEPELTGMTTVSNYAMHWCANYGCQSAPDEQLSRRDDSWDQTKDGDPKYNANGLKTTRDNGLTCHGKYVYNEKNRDSAGYAALLPGLAAYWQDSPHCDNTKFYQTALNLSIDSAGFTVTIEGRSTKAEGLGVLPRPMLLNDSPDLSKEVLIKGDPHPAPRMRAFMAIVEDEQLHSDLKDRNLCQVKEIVTVLKAPQKEKSADTSDANDSISITKGDLMWVELGSPFADANSGLLARPRKGNVLFCIDRGDMSIPIVLTSMFRHDNAMPVANLRPRSGEAYVVDLNAVTIRNRSYDKKDSSNTREHKTVSGINDFSVPKSVHVLGTESPNCSQIQLIGKNNDTDPKVFLRTGAWPHQYEITTRSDYVTRGGNKNRINYSDCLSRLAIPETMLSIATGKNMANNMVYKAVHTSKTADLATPLDRKHFQGINISSEKDLLQQSVDSQFINAGGIINLTAAAGITLRVGRNSISITEDGIEITGGFGHVNNPGAHEAYNASGAETLRVSSQHSAGLTLNESGASLSAINAKLAACNNVRMEVSMGSIMELSNYDASVIAPSTSIIGGAALVNTIYFGSQTALEFICGMSEDFGDSETAGTAKDSIDIGMSYFIEGFGFIKDVVSDGLAKWGNLMSITGSMIDMGPTSMDFNSLTCNLASGEHHIYVDPISGFNALSKSTVGLIIPAVVARGLSLDKDSKTIVKNTVRSLQADRQSIKNSGIHIKNEYKVVKQDDLYALESTSTVSQNNKTLNNNQQAVNSTEEEVNNRRASAAQNNQVLSNDEVAALTSKLDSLRNASIALNNNN